MKSPLQKISPQWLPYAAAIVVFYLISVIYFTPVIEGKKIRASDTLQFKGAAKEINDFRNKTGEEALWTNGMFSGMPAYQISTRYNLNLMKYADRVLKLGFYSPIGPVVMYFIGFFILLIVLRVNPWLSIAGAIAFAFSSYFFIILEAGHNSKANAIGYMAPVLAGIILAYRGKYLAGGAILAFFMALEILSGHPQITYYLLIMMLVYGITEFIRHYKEGRFRDFLISTGVVVLAILLAVLSHAASLWGTYEYSKYTIRSKSELTHDKENQTSGLDKDYATSYSYGIPETMTLLIPNFQGGSSHAALSENSDTYKTLKDNRVPNADQIIRALPMYWGPQAFTSGPVYVGAMIVFLFIFSMFFLKGPIKWWGLAIVLLSILLAWGRHFMALTGFFLDYIPWYNKFRTVSMILVMAELVMPLMAILAVSKLLEGGYEKMKLLKHLKYTGIITGSILLFFILFAGSLFSFSSPSDTQMGLPDWLLEAIRNDRKAMLRGDAIRSLVFVLLGFGLIWAFISGKIKKNHVLVILPVLLVIDMWPVAKRYLNNDDFERKSAIDNPFPMTKADQAILQDKGLYYRVYNLGEPFDQSARTSFFHKNIGGYHGAKFRRYQELVDYHLTPERTRLAASLSNNPTEQSVSQALRGLNAFNMLNTRYFIYNNDAPPLVNPYALGNAWFVKAYRITEDADEEIGAIATLDPDSVAVIDKRFARFVEGYTPVPDPGASITLSEYQPNRLLYRYSASSDQLAVFSEVYYDKGWNAYVDGNKMPHFRANYLLRAMVLPSGDHGLEFRFEPRSFFVGQKVSLASSGLILVLLAGVALFSLRKSKRS